MAAKTKTAKKPSFSPKPGDNVRAKIAGKVVGPIYFAQIVAGKAELQGRERHRVALEDLVPLED